MLVVYVFSWARLDQPLPVIDGIKMVYFDVVSSAGMMLQAWHW